MDILSTRAPGIIDDLTGALPMLAPYLVGVATGGVGPWLLQILGLTILGMGLITCSEPNVARVLPPGARVARDSAGGSHPAVSPRLVGLMESAAAATTRRPPRALV